MPPSRKWILGGAGVAILVFLLAFVLFVNPAHNRANSLRAEVTSQKDANLASASRLALLKRQSAEVPAKVEEIKAIQRKLPPTLQLPTLVRAISAEASKAGVTLQSINPSPPTPQVTGGSQSGSPDLVSVTIGITADGSYASIKAFIAALEGMERAFFIQHIGISANSGVAPGTGPTGAPTPVSTPGATPTPGVTPIPEPTPLPTELTSDLSLDLQGRVFVLPDQSLAAATTQTPAPTATAPPPAAPAPGATPAPSLTPAPKTTPAPALTASPATTAGQSAAQLPLDHVTGTGGSKRQKAKAARRALMNASGRANIRASAQ